MSNQQKGFSLIELLIVVAIILIISAIAIPSMIRAKAAANQSSAAASLRTISSAAASYSSSYQDGYPPNLAVLGPPAGATGCNAAGLIDGVLVTGQKSGYAFTWNVGSTQVAPGNVPAGCPAGYVDMYSVNASPFGFPTGTTYYCVDATGVIRQSANAIATTAAGGCDSTQLPIGEN